MTIVVEDTRGRIRNLPIDLRLKDILIKSGEHASVDKVRVISGGQCAKGTCIQRTGSTRHDLGRAADLELWNGGKPLLFTNALDLKVFIEFVYQAAKLGATGIGAGVNYMGANRIHVGFGFRAVWGEGGKSANAPSWVREAVLRGWSESSKKIPATYIVTARDGVHIRGMPSATDGKSLFQLQANTIVNVRQDDANGDWVLVDTLGDGLYDGYVHSPFLTEIDLTKEDLDESLELEEDTADHLE